MISYADLLEEMIELVKEDADALGCMREIDHARHIVRHGTSAHRQTNAYNQALAEGRSEAGAQKAIVDMLIADTMHGI